MNLEEQIDVLEYEVINEDDPDTLARIVTKKLANGWSLYGNPFYGEAAVRKMFCQAVTRQATVKRSAFEGRFSERSSPVSTEIIKRAIVTKVVPPKGS